MSDYSQARVVAVHAHPDDEAIWTGGLLATLAAQGAQVTVVTCTLGEQGEVIGEPFSQLVADDADQLGGFRVFELRQSLEVLGVSGEFLGAAGRWRDSGMAGDPANEHPRAFIHSGQEAVEQLRSILERIKPQLLLTYGPDGGYGHPDHIRAHEIAHEASQGTSVQRILWAVTSRKALEEGLDAITEIPEGWRPAEPGELACVDDTQVSLCVDLGRDALAAKAAAMKAHATQLWFADGEESFVNPHAATATVQDSQKAAEVFALSNLIAQPLMPTEHYQLGWGTPLPEGAKSALEGLEL